MEPIMKKLHYIEDKLDRLASVIAIMTFAVMSVLVCMQVISRFFSHILSNGRKKWADISSYGAQCSPLPVPSIPI